MSAERGYLATVAAIWIIGGAAGYFYAQVLNTPREIVLIALPAILTELSFYAAMAFSGIRERLAALGPIGASLLALSAAVPYAIYTLPLGLFDFKAAIALIGLAFVVSFWYFAFPRKQFVDIALLCVLVAVSLLKVFAEIYPRAGPRRMDFLGPLMWIRCGMAAMLVFRRIEGVGFGFWPKGHEWRIGLREYVFFLLIGAPLAWWLRFAAPNPRWSGPLMLAITLGTFLAVLWVLALSEEFVFRGLLQQWWTDWLKSDLAANIVTSLLFGAVHLPFDQFPNWRFALLAAIAGFFYGRAFIAARSIRASMVAHALVVTTWQLFFR